jgi:serine phosphatase RsbU (regulator of sigma subunit)
MASQIFVTMPRFFARLVNAGLGDNDSLDVRKMTRIANQSSLVIIASLLLALGINTAVLVSLLTQKLDYSSELVYYIPQGGALVLAILFYRLRVTTHRMAFFFGELYAGASFAVVQSIFMGNYAHVHFLLFAAALLPMFFLDAFSLKTVLLNELVIFLLLSGTFAWFEYHPQGLMPQIEAMRIPTKVFFAIALFTILLLFAYYLWSQNHRNKLALLEQKRIVQEQNELLTEKDTLMQRELDLASEIQKQILPPDDFAWQNVMVRTTYRPLGKVSGDYYEVKDTPEGLFVMVADVSGHGVPAALVTMLCKQVFSEFIISGTSPAQVLIAANSTLYTLVKMSAFISAFLLKIDKNLKAEYCNAGHNYPVYFSATGTAPVELTLSGPAIGFLADASAQLQNSSLQLAPGDRIFMYTDGIIEQTNERGEQFGLQNLIQTLGAMANGHHRGLFSKVDDHRGSAEMGDDMTLLSIEIQK